MRNAFIVSAALLLVGTLGGGFTAFRLATNHEAAASAEAGGEASTPATSTPAADGTSGTAGTGTTMAGNAASSDAAANDTTGTGTSATASAAQGSTPTSTAAPSSSSTSSTIPDPNAAGAPGKNVDNATEDSANNPASGTQASAAQTDQTNGVNDLSAGSMPTSRAPQSPNASGNAPGKTQPAGNASAAEGAVVVAKDGASGQSSTTPAEGAPTQPTSADNPSGKAPAPGSSAETRSDSTSQTAPAAAGAGDAGAGKLIFTGAKKPEVNCAVCHGAGGKGGIGANLTTADGPKSWDDAQFTAALRQGQAPNKMLNTTMPRFTDAQLSDDEIVNIHAFIKTLK
ncbi:c-type cytochrome [Deinococcus alpinitundrae]|uniref:c-type cytochrome n=1 Tax=Deinococcus alpinitundrae TaxID=468913 RepID=UPI00137AA032|nr:cytochrome c [Deinococcus alpinitundrae]